MKIEYDRQADAMYVRYTNHAVVSTRESAEGIVDYDREGSVVGIEMLGVKDLFKQNNIALSESEVVTH